MYVTKKKSVRTNFRLVKATQNYSDLNSREKLEGQIYPSRLITHPSKYCFRQ